MKYTLTIDGSSVMRDDGACIPYDDLNRDYRDYLDWLADGNTPDPVPVPPVTVPGAVTRFQAMQIMLSTPSKINPAPATLLSDVQAIVTTTGGLMQLAWANQQFVYRHGAFVTPALMAAVGLTDNDVDAMFVAASLLPQ